MLQAFEVADVMMCPWLRDTRRRWGEASRWVDGGLKQCPWMSRSACT